MEDKKALHRALQTGVELFKVECLLLALRLAQQEELEDADLCFGVGDFPVHHHLHCLHKGNAQHIQKFSVVQLLHTLVQTACAVDVDDLGAIGRGGIQLR